MPDTFFAKFKARQHSSAQKPCAVTFLVAFATPEFMGELSLFIVLINAADKLHLTAPDKMAADLIAEQECRLPSEGVI